MGIKERKKKKQDKQYKRTEQTKYINNQNKCKFKKKRLSD